MKRRELPKLIVYQRINKYGVGGQLPSPGSRLLSKMHKLLSVMNFDIREKFWMGGLPRINPFGKKGGLGPELVTDGGFDDATKWSAGSAWSVSAGVASYNDSGNSSLSQSFAAQLSLVQLEFDVSGTTPTMTIQSGNGAVTYIASTTYSSGHYKLQFTHSGLGGIRFLGTTTGTAFTLDNVSMRKVL